MATLSLTGWETLEECRECSSAGPLFYCLSGTTISLRITWFPSSTSLFLQVETSKMSKTIKRHLLRHLLTWKTNSHCKIWNLLSFSTQRNTYVSCWELSCVVHARRNAKFARLHGWRLLLSRHANHSKRRLTLCNFCGNSAKLMPRSDFSWLGINWRGLSSKAVTSR